MHPKFGVVIDMLALMIYFLLFVTFEIGCVRICYLRYVFFRSGIYIYTGNSCSSFIRSIFLCFVFFISSSALTRILYWIVMGKTGVSLFCLRLRYRMLISSQYWTCVFYFMQYHYCPYLSPNIASPGNCRTNKQSFLHHIPNCSQRCKF